MPQNLEDLAKNHQAMKLLGNSVAVNVVKEIGSLIKYHLENFSK